MKKIGIMGGTFNPIHNGHLEMANKAYHQFALDEIWFMPTKNPPHKEIDGNTSDKQRVEMISLAIQAYPHFALSTLELERVGMTYTKDTLEEVAKKYPENYFYFIIGSDSLLYIDKWMEAEKLLSMAHLLSAPRYPSNPKEDNEKKEFLERHFGADIQFIDMKPVIVSSQQIRNSIRKGEDISSFLPKKVGDYIKENGLYCLKENREV